MLNRPELIGHACSGFGHNELNISIQSRPPIKSLLFIFFTKKKKVRATEINSFR